MKKPSGDQPNRVRVVFEDGLRSFNLPSHVTGAELAARLGQLERRYGGEPLYVSVRLGS